MGVAGGAHSLEEAPGRELGTPGREGPAPARRPGRPGTLGSLGWSVLPRGPEAGPVPSASPAARTAPHSGDRATREEGQEHGLADRTRLGVLPGRVLAQSQGRALGEWDSVRAGWAPALKGRGDLSERPDPRMEPPPRARPAPGQQRTVFLRQRVGVGVRGPEGRVSTHFVSQPRKEGAKAESRSPPQATTQPPTSARHRAQWALSPGF